jgi:hypothetical protein
MVREPESNPWPKSAPAFWLISASSTASWASAREAATLPAATAAPLASPRSTARRLW